MQVEPIVKDLTKQVPEYLKTLPWRGLASLHQVAKERGVPRAANPPSKA